MRAPPKLKFMNFDTLKVVIDSLTRRLEVVEAENVSLKSRVAVLESEKKENESAVNWARFTSGNEKNTAI
jgi:hypothetical protein